MGAMGGAMGAPAGGGEAVAERGVALRILLTGSVRIESGGTLIEERRFPGRQGRLLFAYLVAERGRPVTRAELAEALWPGGSPPTWEKALSVLVSKVRALLAECGIDAATALTSAFGCYRLELPAGVWVDVTAAEELARRGSAELAAGRSEEAIIDASEAQAIASAPFLPSEEGEWVQARRGALADLADEAAVCVAEAHLAAGRPVEAVRWAERIVAAQPFRESGYRRLMRAHAAAGNRAEGLRVFDRCRRVLADELGAFPSPETDAVFRNLLEAPTERTASATAIPKGVPAAARGSPRFGRRAAVIAAVVAAVAAGVAVPLVLTSGAGRGSVRTTARFTALAVARGGLWALDSAHARAVRLDAAGRVAESVQVGETPGGIALAGGGVWVPDAGTGTVLRIDPAVARVVQSVPVGDGPGPVAGADSVLWVGNRLDSSLTRIDALAGRSVATVPLPAPPSGIAIGAGAVWVTAQAAATVFRIDPRRNVVTEAIGVGHGPDSIVVAASGVWVGNRGDRTLSRIDPDTNTVVATVQIGGSPVALAVRAGSVWAATQGPDALVRVDAGSAQARGRVALDGPPTAVAASRGKVWVSTGSVPRRGGTLRVVASAGPGSMDPALAYDAVRWQLLATAYDGLLGFRRVEGPDGAAVVPDLAAALPAVSDGGLTYAVRLRPGLRYSDGSPVRARDARSTIERLLRLRSPGAQYYAAIQGAAACTPSACDLSRAIVTDDASGSIVFHLAHSDPDFPQELALPFAWLVPADTPARGSGARPPPGTGPYRFASVLPRGVTLERNGYFRQWSGDAQPAGNPDRIVVRFAASDQSAVAPGALAWADVASGRPSPARSDELLVRFAARTQISPLPATFFFYLNTRVAPFDHVGVRTAANLAVDRSSISRALGGPLLAQPTCQALPPAFPGYRPYCPYTAGDTRAGLWRAPDLGRARQLIQAAGARGQRVVVWSFPEFATATRVFAAALRAAGLSASAKIVSADTLFSAAGDSRRRVQASGSYWVADYPSPLGFLFKLFDCESFQPADASNTNASEFCDPRAEEAMRRAQAAQVEDLGSASRLWAAADRRITDLAPAVAVANLRTVDVLSRRVHGYQDHPVWGALLDQLWIR